VTNALPLHQTATMYMCISGHFEQIKLIELIEYRHVFGNPGTNDDGNQMRNYVAGRRVFV